LRATSSVLCKAPIVPSRKPFKIQAAHHPKVVGIALRWERFTSGEILTGRGFALERFFVTEKKYVHRYNGRSSWVKKVPG
jgi:hypothetical protein